MDYKIFLFLCLLLIGSEVKAQEANNTFPSNVRFGFATASYQVEGGWNEGGKGENIWDRLTHENPDAVVDRDNGDVADDAYHHALEDVQLLVDLGAEVFRFSLSWSRILPLGYDYIINEQGIAYYNSLIDALLENNITPLVTIYHWDLPQPLQDIGGWPNPEIADHFVNYARIVFEQFGDRVKNWITFNEPKQTCLQGYGDATMAPLIDHSGVDDYACAYTLLNAHARTWHLYDEEYRPTQNGIISITIDTPWCEPGDPDDPESVDAAEREIQFTFGWYANPIFSTEGNWPQVMIDRVAERSAQEGFEQSRLPAFTEEELVSLRGTYDFFGLNIYTTNLVIPADEAPYDTVSYYNDKNTNTYQDADWPGSASSWLKVVPWGATRLINWVQDRYNDPLIFITENGISDTGTLDDTARIDFYTQYLRAILDSIQQNNARVELYTAWSLLDNFEWMRGFSEKFGIYQVNFTDPNRARTPKESVGFWREFIRTKTVPEPGEERKPVPLKLPVPLA